MTTYAFYDVDGTLLDDSRRKGLANAKNWDAYHDAVTGDTKGPAYQAFQNDLDSDEVNVYIHSGKPYNKFPATREKILDIYLRHINWKSAVPSASGGIVFLSTIDNTRDFNANQKLIDALNFVECRANGQYDKGNANIKINHIFRRINCLDIKSGDKVSIYDDDKETLTKMYEAFKRYSDTKGNGLIFCFNHVSFERHNPKINTVYYIGDLPVVPNNDFRAHTVDCRCVIEEIKKPAVINMEEAIKTFKERNAVYGQNSIVYGKVMEALFSEMDIELRTANDHELYMFLSHIVGKLTRFIGSGLTHEDSLHDMITYCALAQGVLQKIKASK